MKLMSLVKKYLNVLLNKESQNWVENSSIAKIPYLIDLSLKKLCQRYFWLKQSKLLPKWKNLQNQMVRLTLWKILFSTSLFLPYLDSSNIHVCFHVIDLIIAKLSILKSKFTFPPPSPNINFEFHSSRLFHQIEKRGLLLLNPSFNFIFPEKY